MNQILSTESSPKKEKRKKNKNRNGNYQSDVMRKAVIIFSILLIIFALAIIGVKIVQINKEKSKSGKIYELNKPEISIERVDTDKVNIKISYDEEISKVSWWWNDDISQIQEKNYHVVSVNIDIPEGASNVLHIKVTGKDGSTNEISETLTRDLTTTIEWNQISETDNMEIIAKSENGIEKLVYYWNDEPSITVPATEENQQELKTTIQLKRGTNTLHTIVTDNLGNKEEKEQILQCVKEPVIDVEISLDQMLIVMTVTHDMGFKKIEFIINGQTMAYDENYSGYDSTAAELTFHAPLQEGIDNVVEINAYSNEKIDENETTHASFKGHKDLTQTTEEE